jgi:hypothetical protein
MKHINPKIHRLLIEGFSIKTLEKFDSKQIDILFERVKKTKKEETKEQAKPIERTVTSKVTEIPSGGQIVAPANAKIENKGGKTIVTQTQTEGEVTEKALSKKQQQFFGIVRGMQKGDIPKKGKAGEAAKEMKKKDVKDFASTKHKGLPEKKKKETKEMVKNLEESIMNLIEKHLNPEIKKSDVLNMIRKK